MNWAELTVIADPRWPDIEKRVRETLEASHVTQEHDDPGYIEWWANEAHDLLKDLVWVLETNGQ